MDQRGTGRSTPRLDCAELATLPDPATKTAYSTNSAAWSYMKAGGPENFGVAEAWRMLAIANRLSNKVKIGVIDERCEHQLRLLERRIEGICDVDLYAPFTVSTGVRPLTPGDNSARLGQCTSYSTPFSASVVDTPDGPTITVPLIPSGRDASVYLADNDHYVLFVIHEPGVHDLPRNTRHLGVGARGAGDSATYQAPETEAFWPITGYGAAG